MTLSQNGNYEIPLNYRVPLVDLNERERNEINSIREQQAAAGAMSAWGMNNNSNRPRKQLFIVSFKGIFRIWSAEESGFGAGKGATSCRDFGERMAT